MCGRFTLHLDDLSELRVLLGVKRVLVSSWRPRYNIAPTQTAPVVLPGEERTLREFRWGLVPRGAKDPRVGNRMINARVESIDERPSFRHAFRERRCVVPATGYFEWQARPGERSKQPFWISPSDNPIMALAGLYESFVTDEGQVMETFAIVTTEAAPELRAVHDRMPLELRGEHIDAWLRAGELPKSTLGSMTRDAQNTSHLRLREVDRRVSAPAFDEPACIASPTPTEPPRRRQLGLFD